MRRANSVVLPLMALAAALSGTACGQKGPLTLAPAAAPVVSPSPGAVPAPAAQAAPPVASAPAVLPAAPAGTAR